MTIGTLLKRVPLFSELTHVELTTLAKIGWKQRAGANQSLFREGDPGNQLYVILSGSVRIYRADRQGQVIELATLKTGDYFGELALIDAELRSAAAATLTPCELFIIGRPDFLSLLTASPEMLNDLLVGISNRSRHSVEQFFKTALQQETLRVQGEIERHRAIAQMVAGVAHEINTPLGIANHAASIVTEQLKNPELQRLRGDGAFTEVLRDIKDAADLIQANLTRAARLIQTFKNLSVRQMTDVRETVDLVQLTKEMIDLYRFKARESRLELRLINRLDETARQWMGYPGYFSQIMLNLISNIDRYAYPEGNGGPVEIMLEAQYVPSETPRFVVTVRDFGVGLPPDQSARVFEPFFTTGRTRGGTGLGLSIVYNLITQALHGTIRLESAPGEGTRIIMAFPQSIEETLEKQTAELERSTSI